MGALFIYSILQHGENCFRELSGDYVQPTFQTSNGGMSTVGLSGTKSSIHDVPVNGSECAC